MERVNRVGQWQRDGTEHGTQTGGLMHRVSRCEIRAKCLLFSANRGVRNPRERGVLMHHNALGIDRSVVFLARLAQNHLGMGELKVIPVFPIALVV